MYLQAIKILPESALNKILTKALNEIKNKKGSDKLVSKIEKLLEFGSKESKKEFIREVIKKNDERKIQEVENKFAKAAKTETLTEGELGKAGKIITGGVAGVATGAGLFAAGAKVGAAAAAAGSAPLAIGAVPIAIIITLLSSLLVTGLSMMIADSKNYYSN